MQECPGKGAADFLCKLVRIFAAKALYTAICFRGGGNAEALYHLFQCADIHRLRQMLVHAGFLALLHILKEGIGSHGKDAVAVVMPQTCKNERREIFFIIQIPSSHYRKAVLRRCSSAVLP